MSASSSNHEKLDFLQELKKSLEQNIFYNSLVAGVNIDDVEMKIIDLEQHAQISTNNGPLQHVAFISMARSINKLHAVIKKIEDLNNA